MINYLASFVNTDGAAFPDTESVNVSAPGAGDGTEFVKLMVDDIWGRAQALLDYAGLVPDGISEAPDTAQVLDAIRLGFVVGPGIIVNYPKNDTPAVHGDRLLLLQGQVILIATYPLLDAAVWVGAGANPTAPAFYRTQDAAGLIRNVAGPYLVLPDSRGLGFKNIGDATVNARVKTGPVELGEMQEDQGQDWQLGASEDGTGARDYWCLAGGRDFNNTTQIQANYTPFYMVTTAQGDSKMLKAMNDGTNGDPRQGVSTRDSILGTNFGITY